MKLMRIHNAATWYMWCLTEVGNRLFFASPISNTVRCRPGQNVVTWKTPSRASFHSPSRASRRTRFLRSPHTNVGVKHYECGRTQPLFCADHDHG
jgi:hypothetical protein